MIHQAKKSLGQNFLKSKPALNMMCEAGEVGDKDTVLEIGPGKGALTEKLLSAQSALHNESDGEKAGKVIAIEKDRELFEFLQEKFKDGIKNEKLILVEDDILEFEANAYGLKPSAYKLIANIPYNITGAILKKFLSCDNQPERMVLLVQKEVAERIVARDGKESILSLSIKAYGTPKYVMKVSKRFFSPAPKVDSAIIAITNISKVNFRSQEEETLFFDLIKTGFAHKRKVLRKNLEVGLPCIKNLEQIDEIFGKLEINGKARAEDINFEKWLEITRHLSTVF
jgi:16S rRNA (adenine1518-N6/adenine1519-N6)-dimethyltransferase